MPKLWCTFSSIWYYSLGLSVFSGISSLKLYSLYNIGQIVKYILSFGCEHNHNWVKVFKIKTLSNEIATNSTCSINTINTETVYSIGICSQVLKKVAAVLYMFVYLHMINNWIRHIKMQHLSLSKQETEKYISLYVLSTLPKPVLFHRKDGGQTQ